MTNRWCAICRYLPKVEGDDLCASCRAYELDQTPSDEPLLLIGGYRLVEVVAYL